MDKNVPLGAALLLDFIGDIEAPKGYGTIYANRQGTLPKPLTSMTVDEVIAAGPGWTKAHKSSAAGRYQFMNNTLKGLKKELGLRGSQVFDANLQDRLGYHLLLRRGYSAFMANQISATEFGKRLAQEWASLPVLAATKGGSREVKRGQSYYAGDGLNKSLVQPEAVEAIIARAKAAFPDPAPLPDAPIIVDTLPPHKPSPPWLWPLVTLSIFSLIAAVGWAITNIRF